MILTNKALILLIDDNPSDLQSLGRILIENGYEVATVKDYADAHTFIETQTPDMIILDKTLSHADSLDVCRRLKEHPKANKTPVLFILDQQALHTKEQVYQAGAGDYVIKPFSRDEILARIGVHIKLRQTLKKLCEMSITDEMTGVYNRRFAYRILNRQMEVAKRQKHSFALCLVEIEMLKLVNDTYGHEQGDYLIMTVIKGLQEIIRLTDYIFRLGGDEFLVLLVNTDLKEAQKVIARLRKKLNQQYIQDMPIDFSYGFAEYRFQEKNSADGLIQLAEADMGIDKENRKI